MLGCLLLGQADKTDGEDQDEGDDQTVEQCGHTKQGSAPRGTREQKRVRLKLDAGQRRSQGVTGQGWQTGEEQAVKLR